MKLLTFLLTFTFLTSIFANSSPQDKKAFSGALATYEKLHDAFFKNNLEDVKKVSTQLGKDLNKITGKEVSKALDSTRKKVKNLIKATNMETAHKDFNVVSQGMLMVLDRFIPNKTYARYYCPMVKKYWIQNISESDKVMNPYAADTMPHCGGKME